MNIHKAGGVVKAAVAKALLDVTGGTGRTGLPFVRMLCVGVCVSQSEHV